MHYALCLVLFMVGFYGVMVKRNLIKIIISLIIMESAVNLFLVMIGYRKDGIAPIMSKGMETEAFIRTSVDPVPQALVLTAIVIGLGVTAMTIAIAMRLYERYGTYDIKEMRKLKG
ncbi:MAG: NADH-quinone oxidoreductase subunit K [Candidatus Eisenbacteria bacterium]